MNRPCCRYLVVLFVIVLGMSRSLLASDDDADRKYDGLTLSQWHARLGELDPQDPHAATVVPGLIAIIQDGSLPSKVRRPFAMALGRIGSSARDAIPVFISQIEHRKQNAEPTYAWAARALGLYGVQARDAAPALVDLLFDEEVPQGFRTLPIEALARIGTAHPAVMPALVRLLQYQSPDATQVSAADASVFRGLAAEALRIIGPDAELAAPLLVRAVRDSRESESVRRKAIIALGAIGPRAALAIPSLIETVEFGRSTALRDFAGEALGQIGPPALPIMQQYLRHSDPLVRSSIARGFGKMGPRASAAAGALLAALDDPDDLVRMAVSESLDAVGINADRYVNQVIDLLTSDQRQVRMRAMRLLVKIGPTADRPLERLRAMQSDSRRDVRAIATKTLQKLESR